MPPPYAIAPYESPPSVDDCETQLENMLFDMEMVLLLTAVLLETELSICMLLRLYEYAPITSEMPPPYAIDPKESWSRVDVIALQLHNVLLEIMYTMLLTSVLPETKGNISLLLPKLYE